MLSNLAPFDIVLIEREILIKRIAYEEQKREFVSNENGFKSLSLTDKKIPNSQYLICKIIESTSFLSWKINTDLSGQSGRQEKSKILVNVVDRDDNFPLRFRQVFCHVDLVDIFGCYRFNTLVRFDIKWNS